MKKTIKASMDFLKVLMVAFVVIALYALLMGIYKKNDYYGNEYVGGDAYNLIINAGYFAGYMALSAGSMVSATLCGTTWMYFEMKEEEKSLKEAPSMESLPKL